MYENYLHSCLAELIPISVAGSNYKYCVSSTKDLRRKFSPLTLPRSFETPFAACYCLLVRLINNSEAEIDLIKIDTRR